MGETMNRRTLWLALALCVGLTGAGLAPSFAAPSSDIEVSAPAIADSNLNPEPSRSNAVNVEPSSPPLSTVAAQEFIPAWVKNNINKKWMSLGGESGLLGKSLSEIDCSWWVCRQEYSGGMIFAVNSFKTTSVLRTAGRVGAHWFAAGEINSGLGSPASDEILYGSGAYQEFETRDGRGRILVAWTPRGGINTVSGASPIGSQFQHRGGVAQYGLPIGPEVCGLRDAGCKQDFEVGTMLSSRASGAAFAKGGMRSKWLSLSAQNGVLGYPTWDETCSELTKSCHQTFQFGDIYWSAKTGAASVRGGIKSAYLQSGTNTPPLGLPLGDERCGLRDRGCVQNFQLGQIIWSPKTKAKTLHGAIGRRYTSAGAQNSFLGYPVGEEVCGFNGGGCKQVFQGGSIAWSAKTGARILRGAIGAKASPMVSAWIGPVGYPLGEEVCGLPRRGCYQQFQTGRIYWSPETRKAEVVKNGILARWNQLGGPGGRMGYPVWNEVCANGYCEQRFQYGTVTWSAPGAIPW